MRLNKLLIALVTLLVIGMMLMVSNVRSQHKEIISLRNRVENLEIVINRDLRLPKQEFSNSQI
jgi:hypothetical protein